MMEDSNFSRMVAASTNDDEYPASARPARQKTLHFIPPPHPVVGLTMPRTRENTEHLRLEFQIATSALAIDYRSNFQL